jgi:EAL domain-containing protein (putative c-di-GMP-specific phosphodiesterase class I)/CheY-like chemotaxis protein
MQDSDAILGRPPDTPSSTARVLVAEDEEAFGRLIKCALTAVGLKVTLVPDGPSAAEAIMSTAFDVVLTDINMPGSSGMDLLRLIRAHDLDVPVLLMTGNPNLDHAMEAIQLGALQYLRKPFPLETAIQAVERAARLHRLALVKRQALQLAGRAREEASDVLSLGLALDRALTSMCVTYQPIVRFTGRKVMAYEALMRTNEPALPHPSAVLDAASRLGRLDEVGRHVRTLVAQGFARAPDNGLLFVNLHPDDLLDPDLSADSAPLSGFARRVVLEITERAAIAGVSDLRNRVEVLRYMGYRIAIDDLGAGYAGLTSFTALEPEFVKVDMSLVRGISESLIRQKLVGSVVTLCGEMQKCVIAEGIETPAERDCLAELGCDWMQGYLFARPDASFPSPDWG